MTKDDGGAPQPELPGLITDINELCFEDKIAEGSSAEVYKGKLRGERVAIKKYKQSISAKTMASEAELALFRKECCLLAGVGTHENILKYHGCYLSPECLIIVTELLVGGTLHEVLQGRAVRGLARVLEIALRMAEAMAHLHEAGVVHRDLKSSNVVFTEDKVLKIIDFGLARYEDPDGNMTGETGSYRWAAPEVLRRERYGKPADVYSYSIVLWEAVTGKVPYASLTPLKAALCVASEGLRPEPLQAAENCPQALCDLVHSCWAEKPSERPTFDAIVIRLQQIRAEHNAYLIPERKGPERVDSFFSFLKRVKEALSPDEA
eukprot:tig00000025_g7913.t1